MVLNLLTGVTVGCRRSIVGLYSISLTKRTAIATQYNPTLTVNQSFVYNGVSYVVTDRREATSVPGKVNCQWWLVKGWQTWTIDARSKHNS